MKQKRYPDAAAAIADYIKDNKLKNNERLPAEKQLAELLDFNHVTIRKGLALLAESGKIHTVPCRGNFVGKGTPAVNRSRLIGILVPDPDSFFYDIIAELEYRMAMFDYSPVIHYTRRSTMREESALNSLVSRGVEGIIAVPGKECRELYRQLELPLVFFDDFLEGENIPYIINDDFQSAFVAVEHLVTLGHRRIAYVGGNDVHSAKQRYNGYCAALEKHQIKSDPAMILQREYSREWGYAAAECLFRGTSLPTAVFCGNDSIASGLLRYLLNYNILCPETVSVIGCCNAPFSEDIGLSTVDQQNSKLAESLWDNLYSLIRGNQVAPVIVMPSRLLLRRTTGRCL